MNGKFGMIIHWGIYSEPGYDDVKSARKRKIQNGSEWYLKRLTENNLFLPTSGHKETKEWHKNNYGDQDYYSFTINEQVDVKEWIDCAKNNGAEYVILTAKHHDGYCLWPSKHAKYHTNRNIVKDFCEEAKRQGIEYGLYYSWMEFGTSITKKFIKEVIKPQINELLCYKPKRWWFDGHWEIKTDFAKREITSICRQLCNAGFYMNDRIPIAYSDQNEIKKKVIEVFEDRYVPATIPMNEWEHINTIGISWGFNGQQEEKDYKSGKELHDLYTKITKMNGKFLLNIGPDRDGMINKNELNSLKEFAKLNNM